MQSFRQFDSRSEADTVQFGAALADCLEPGTVVALVGHLGAGKTRLVQAVAAAAGVDPREVASPTFVLLQEYSGRWPIYHFDAYRITDPAEFLALGAEEYFQSQGISLVEWADRVAVAVPADLRIEMQATAATMNRNAEDLTNAEAGSFGHEAPSHRRIVISAVTERGQRVLDCLASTFLDR